MDTEIIIKSSSIEEDTLNLDSMIQLMSKDETKYIKVDSKEEVYISTNEKY